MKKNDHEEAIDLFKALSDPMRLQILVLISDKEICACKILDYLSISQPTLSHHMKILMSCKLVVGRKEATWMHYTINKKMVKKLHQIIDLCIKDKSNSRRALV